VVKNWKIEIYTPSNHLKRITSSKTPSSRFILEKWMSPYFVLVSLYPSSIVLLKDTTGWLERYKYYKYISWWDEQGNQCMWGLMGRFRGTYRPEDGGDTIHRNAGNYVQDYTMLPLRRRKSTFSQPWKTSNLIQTKAWPSNFELMWHCWGDTIKRHISLKTDAHSYKRNPYKIPC
jgi:hypothetical protein